LGPKRKEIRRIRNTWKFLVCGGDKAKEKGKTNTKVPASPKILWGKKTSGKEGDARGLLVPPTGSGVPVGKNQWRKEKWA